MVHHHADHRVAAGDGMVGQEQHGLALRRDLERARPWCLRWPARPAGSGSAAHRPGACPRGWSGASPAQSWAQRFPCGGVEPVIAGSGDDVQDGHAGSGKSGCSSGLPTTLAAPRRRPAAARRPAAQARSRTWCPWTGCPAPRRLHPAADGQVAAEAALRRADGQDLAVEQGERSGHGHLPHLLGWPTSSSVVQSGASDGVTTVSADGAPATAEPGRPRPARSARRQRIRRRRPTGALPTIRLARRREARSSAPAEDTPSPAWPGRPRSWIRL